MYRNSRNCRIAEFPVFVIHQNDPIVLSAAAASIELGEAVRLIVIGGSVPNRDWFYAKCLLSIMMLQCCSHGAEKSVTETVFYAWFRQLMATLPAEMFELRCPDL